jgi:hypothetical protein
MAICSICNQDKLHYHEETIYPHVKKVYCREFFEYMRETIVCGVCGEKVPQEFYPKHKLDMHSK